MSRQILQCTKLLLTVYSTAQYFWVLLYYIHPVHPVEPSATKCHGRSYSAARCKSWLQPLRALIVCHRQTASCEEMGWNAQETLTFIRSSHCLTFFAWELWQVPILGCWKNFVFSMLEIHIFNCLSETLSKIWNIYRGLLCLSPWMKIFLQKVNSTYRIVNEWARQEGLVLENHFRTSLSRQLL